LTLKEIKDGVTSRFCEGEEVTIRTINDRGKTTGTYKATIDRFYPSHISIFHSGYYESFSYWEFAKYVIKPNQKKRSGVEPVRARRAKYA
jgi:hypothetical protein